MSILYIAGAETANLAELAASNNAAASATVVRTGGSSFRVASGAGDYGEFVYASSGTVYLRFYAYVITAWDTGAADDFCYLASSGKINQAGVKYDSGWKLYHGTAQAAITPPSADAWHLFELRYTAGTGSDGVAELKIDGTVEATITTGTSTADVAEARLFGEAATGAYIYFEDIQVRTDAYPGPGQIEAIRPDGDSADSGEDEFEDEGAAAQTYDSVNQDPLNETNYAIESSQADADHRQLWTLGTIASVGTINHVRIGIQAMRGGGSGTEHRIRSDAGTPENSADLALTTVSVYYTFGPTTQPSNQSELDSFQAGVFRNAGGREFFCYEQWVMVDYTPGAGPATAIRDMIGMGVVPFAR